MNVKWQLAQVVMFVCGVSVAAKGGCSIYSRGKKHMHVKSRLQRYQHLKTSLMVIKP